MSMDMDMYIHATASWHVALRRHQPGGLRARGRDDGAEPSMSMSACACAWERAPCRAHRRPNHAVSIGHAIRADAGSVPVYQLQLLHPTPRRSLENYFQSSSRATCDYAYGRDARQLPTSYDLGRTTTAAAREASACTQRAAIMSLKSYTYQQASALTAARSATAP